MSSSSSSGASAAAAAAFPPANQQQQQMAENLQPALQLPAPVQAAPAEQLCYVHCHFCDTVLVVRDQIKPLLRSLPLSLCISLHFRFFSLKILRAESKTDLTRWCTGVYVYVSVQVSVPSSSLFKTVTVRCGHCSSLLTVNMRGLLLPTTPTSTAAASACAVTTNTTMSPPAPAAAAHHGHQFHFPHLLNLAPSNTPHHSLLDEISSVNPSLQLLEQHGLGGLIAGTGRNAAAPPPPTPAAAAGKGAKEPSPRTNPAVNRPPEKRQRVPSAYNRFIKDEIQRIKAGNPDISHREAFSAAAKNWAHFPHIHFGLMPDHQELRKTSLLPQDHQRKDGLLKDGLYAAAAANMGVAPY